MIRKRLFPLIGDGAGVWSFIHIEDAAEATVAAVERGRRGIYNVVDDEPARSADGCRRWRRRSAPSRPDACPAGWGGCSAARRHDHDDRGARSLERKGQARARLGAELPELATGLRARGSNRAVSNPTRCGMRGATRGAAAEGVRDRLPDAWQRERGRGRGPGGAAAAALGDGARGADRVAARLPGDGGHPARDRRAALGPCAPRDTTWANGCPEPIVTDPEDDPARAGRDGRLALARVPASCWRAWPRAARRLPPARRLRLRLRPSRRDHRHERSERPPARLTGAPPGGRGPAALRGLARNSATSWQSASSRPPRRAISGRWRRCSPRTWCCKVTAVVRRPATGIRSSVAAEDGADAGNWGAARERIGGAAGPRRR